MAIHPHMRNLIVKVILGVVISSSACSRPQTASQNTNRDQSNSAAKEEFDLPEAERKQISEEIFQLWLQASNESVRLLGSAGVVAV